MIVCRQTMSLSFQPFHVCTVLYLKVRLPLLSPFDIPNLQRVKLGNAFDDVRIQTLISIFLLIIPLIDASLFAKHPNLQRDNYSPTSFYKDLELYLETYNASSSTPIFLDWATVISLWNLLQTIDISFMFGYTLVIDKCPQLRTIRIRKNSFYSESTQGIFSVTRCDCLESIVVEKNSFKHGSLFQFMSTICLHIIIRFTSFENDLIELGLYSSL